MSKPVEGVSTERAAETADSVTERVWLTEAEASWRAFPIEGVPLIEFVRAGIVTRLPDEAVHERVLNSTAEFAKSVIRQTPVMREFISNETTGLLSDVLTQFDAQLKAALPAPDVSKLARECAEKVQAWNEYGDSQGSHEADVNYVTQIITPYISSPRAQGDRKQVCVAGYSQARDVWATSSGSLGSSRLGFKV